MVRHWIMRCLVEGGGQTHSLFLSHGSPAVRGQRLVCMEGEKRIFLHPFVCDNKAAFMLL